jgi:hypothetical protein
MAWKDRAILVHAACQNGPPWPNAPFDLDLVLRKPKSAKRRVFHCRNSDRATLWLTASGAIGKLAAGERRHVRSRAEDGWAA